MNKTNQPRCFNQTLSITLINCLFQITRQCFGKKEQNLLPTYYSHNHFFPYLLVPQNLEFIFPQNLWLYWPWKFMWKWLCKWRFSPGIKLRWVLWLRQMPFQGSFRNSCVLPLYSSGGDLNIQCMGCFAHLILLFLGSCCSIVLT